jgi:Predicted metal-binding integral membrane protein (DUF2182)
MLDALMLPALAPFVSLRLADVQLRAPRGAARGVRLALFLLGYLCIWSLCGLPVFLLCLLADGLVVHAPALGIGLGVLLLTAAALYQLTPLKRLCLTHCEVISRHHGACAPSASRRRSLGPGRGAAPRPLLRRLLRRLDAGIDRRRPDESPLDATHQRPGFPGKSMEARPAPAFSAGAGPDFLWPAGLRRALAPERPVQRSLLKSPPLIALRGILHYSKESLGINSPAHCAAPCDIDRKNV